MVMFTLTHARVMLPRRKMLLSLNDSLTFLLMPYVRFSAPQLRNKTVSLFFVLNEVESSLWYLVGLN